MDPRDRASTIVLGVDLKVDLTKFEGLFPGATYVHLQTNSEHNVPVDLPPNKAYGFNSWLWRSRAIMDHLRSRPDRDLINYVEFPDWGGLAFASLQEKLTKCAFKETTIAIRLHTSHAVLCAEEGYNFSQHDRLLADMERKCCRDCDLLISQNLAATDRMREVYGIAKEEWDRKLVEHVPPVVLDNQPIQTASIVPHSRTPILFTSKLQKIKNAKTFIRAAGAFINSEPGFSGDVVFAAHSGASKYATDTLNLVTDHIRDRVKNLEQAAQSRDDLIAEGISVFAGRFESFCLAAYEASLAGGLVVLNEENPAFGDRSPWRDGVNCLKFDGTTHDLQRALRRAYALSNPLDVVAIKSQPKPWKIKHRGSTNAEQSEKSCVSIIVTYGGEDDGIFATLESCLEQTYSMIEVIVVDHRKGKRSGDDVLHHIEDVGMTTVRVVRVGYDIGSTAARNVGLEEAIGEYVCFLSPGQTFSHEFVGIGADCLANSVALGFVTSSCARNKDSYGPQVIGEAILSGVHENLFVAPGFLVRKSLFSQTRFDEDLGRFGEWSLIQDLVRRGIRGAVVNDAGVFSPEPRRDSIHATDDLEIIEELKNVYRIARRQSRGYPLDFMALGNDLDTGLQHARLLADLQNANATQLTSIKAAHEETLQALSNANEEMSRQFEGARSRIMFLEGHVAQRSKMIGALIKELRAKRFLRRVGDKKLIERLLDIYGFFDATWYLENNPDVRDANIDPTTHYLRYGLKEGRAPNPYFLPQRYVDAYPDAAETEYSALEHYLLIGMPQGRLI